MKINSRAYSDIAKTGPIRPRSSDTKSASDTQSASRAGSVDLSPEAQALYGSSSGADEIRPDLVAEAKAEIEAGTLFSDENIDKAIDRLMAELI